MSPSACKPTSLLLYRHYRSQPQTIARTLWRAQIHAQRAPTWPPISIDSCITVQGHADNFSHRYVSSHGWPWINARGTEKNENKCESRNDENSFAVGSSSSSTRRKFRSRFRALCPICCWVIRVNGTSLNFGARNIDWRLLSLSLSLSFYIHASCGFYYQFVLNEASAIM